MGDSEEARGFLILCDKNLETQVGDVVSKLSDGSGEIIIKTIEDIQSPQIRGDTFSKKFETILRWAHGVVFVSSSNFASFIDGKKKDNLPTLLNNNHKDSHNVLQNFIKAESKKSTNKLMAISVNGDKTLPKSMSRNVQVLIQEPGQQHIFIESLKGMIAAKMNE